MENSNNVASEIIVHLLSLMGIQSDQWTGEDVKMVKRAREFVQQQRKVTSESQDQERSRAALPNPSAQPDAPEAQRGVYGQGISLEERAEDDDKSSSSC